jgi:hypothetical protein
MATIHHTGVDYSWGRPNLADVKTKGYKLVMRYLGNTSRDITVLERDRIYQAGLRLGLIGQLGAVDRPRGGYKQGLEDGTFFRNEAKELGWPKGKPILCAVADVGTPPGRPAFPTWQDLPQIREFKRGLFDGLAGEYTLGIYGPEWILEQFRGDPQIVCFWQCAGGSGNGQGTGGSAYNAGDGTWRKLSNLACMYQEYGSVSVPETDHNQVFEKNLRIFTHHPDDTSEEIPEEALVSKVVFCPDQTGGTGWLPFIIDGKRYRVGYTAAEDLQADAGIVDGSVELRGAIGERFLYNYKDGLPYDGPRLVGVTGDTEWGREVAGLAPGEMGRFYVVPNRYTIRVRNDEQWNTDRFVGVPHTDFGQAFLWNQPLVEWKSKVVVDVDLDDVEVNASVTMADKTEIAIMTSDMLAKRLSD